MVMPGEMDAVEASKLSSLVRNGIINKHESLMAISTMEYVGDNQSS